MKHTPEDSLRYLMASDAAGAALEHLDPDNPDNEIAVAILETSRRELRYEARLHGIEGTARYSTGFTVFAEGQHTAAEPRDDGTTELVTHPTVWCPYPGDGGKAHPICRRDEGPAA
ncbi:hypothetical protein ACFORJ_06985 [Corynebacterium hansenii]|uniref:Uncharacterized protein n=1 Tax=Corynebacterium hansenii TaxID=394964 RepID=A0ABV7ZN15_9CORY|nr:hypothetical protein [Corynebacterium hansenii]WJZ00491.1 hypothetical protein CHAN_09435 [Corynebacterium hansenii]